MFEYISRTLCNFKVGMEASKVWDDVVCAKRGNNNVGKPKECKERERTETAASATAQFSFDVDSSADEYQETDYGA